MTFFAKYQHIAEWHARRVALGDRGVFVGKAGRFRGEWQLANPQMTIFGMADSEDGEAADDQMAVGALFPIYPLTTGSSPGT